MRRDAISGLANRGGRGREQNIVRTVCGQKMRIAQISPLYESVPPKLYGGTERIVSYLTEELVELGHDVTLFASGDSVTEARLVVASEEALRHRSTRVQDPTMHHVRLLEMVFSEASRFDILHFHIDYLHLPLSRRHKGISLTTLHGRLDLGDLVALFKRFSDLPVVSISDAQRLPLEWLELVWNRISWNSRAPIFVPRKAG